MTSPSPFVFIGRQKDFALGIGKNNGSLVTAFRYDVAAGGRSGRLVEFPTEAPQAAAAAAHGAAAQLQLELNPFRQRQLARATPAAPDR